VAGLAFVDSIAQFRVPNVVLAELDHPTGQINVWSGYGLLEYDGKTWKGTGHLGSVSIPSISSETTSEDVVFTLTGVDPEYLDGLEQTVRGRIGCVWLGVVSPERKIVHTNKVCEASLVQQSYSLDEDGRATIKISGKGGFYNLRSQTSARIDAENQKQFLTARGLDPLTDTGYDYVAEMVNSQVIVGAA